MPLTQTESGIAKDLEYTKQNNVAAPISRSGEFS
jgi:hypothetical protein